MVTAKFVCSLITVADITRSRDFYEKVLGQKVEADFGENVSFGGFSIHLRAHFQNLIENKVITANANNFELYFESDDLVQTVEILKEYKDHRAIGSRKVIEEKLGLYPGEIKCLEE